MRVCVALQSKDIGENETRLAAHFGMAERFAIIDSQSGELLSECGISGHCPGPCHCPLPNLADQGVEALVGQAVGYRLLQISRRAGVPVLAAKAHTLSELRREIAKKAPSRPLTAAICLTHLRCQVPAGKN